MEARKIEIERNDEKLTAEKIAINAGLRELRGRGAQVVGISVSLHAGREMLAWAERQGWLAQEMDRLMRIGSLDGQPYREVYGMQLTRPGLPPVRNGWIYERVAGVDFMVATTPAPLRDDVSSAPVEAEEPQESAVPAELAEAMTLVREDGGEVVGCLAEGAHDWMQQLDWQRTGRTDSRMIGRPEADEELDTHLRRWECWNDLQVLVSRPKVQQAQATAPAAVGIRLRGYQERTIASLYDAWDRGLVRVLVQSVTGSGKSVMIARVVRDWAEQGGTALLLAHTRELIFQLRDHLVRGGVPEGEVGILMGGYAPAPGQRIVVSTIQSAGKLEVEEGKLLIVIDEAHHAGSKSYVAQLEALKPARVLGVTATPARKSGTALSDVFEDMITALEYEQGFTGLDGDAPYLVRPRYFVPSAHDVEALKAMQKQIADAPMQNGEITPEAAEAIIRANPQIIGDIVEHIGKLADDRQGIVFAATVAHAEAIAEAIRADGRTAAMICGETPKDHRDEIMQAFRDGEISWLSSVQVLTEGVDVPDVGAVFCARPTKNPVFWCQMLGRGLRRPVAEDPADQKLDCIFADFTGSFLHMGPVDAYDSAYWLSKWEQGGKAKGTAQQKRERTVSTADAARTCRCGCKWEGGPICPACGAIGNSKRFAAENTRALNAELQEVRTPEDMKLLISTLKGGNAGPRELMMVMTSKLTREQRQQALCRIMTSVQQLQMWGQIVRWVQIQGSRPGRAYYLYKDLMGKGPNPAWGKEPMSLTPDGELLIRELLRKKAAHDRLSGRAWSRQPAA